MDDDACAAICIGGGGFGVLGHFGPLGLAAGVAGDGFEGVVDAIEHEVLGFVEDAFGLALAEGLAEDVLESGPGRCAR